MEAPELDDFIDFAAGKVDCLKFSISSEEFEEREEFFEELEINILIFRSQYWVPPIIIRC